MKLSANLLPVPEYAPWLCPAVCRSKTQPFPAGIVTCWDPDYVYNYPNQFVNQPPNPEPTLRLGGQNVFIVALTLQRGAQNHNAKITFLTFNHGPNPHQLLP
jgi:hypothetical protein